MRDSSPTTEKSDGDAGGTGTASTVALWTATKVWARIGLLSFGGPAGQIALMHRELVERRRWIDEGRFLHALNYCMLLPGPEAQQLATYIGWLMHRTLGGVVAGVLFIVPGFVAILGLSLLYAGFGAVPWVSALFFGLKAAVLAIVVDALLRIGRRALTRRWLVGVAVGSFCAVHVLHAPFPLIVVGAGILGGVVQRRFPSALQAPDDEASPAADGTLVDQLAARGALGHTVPSWRSAALTVLVCGGLWFLPLAVLSRVFGAQSVFVEEGLFFSKTAVVTFGGAYAVLGYVAQRAVDTYAWLSASQMLDGFGLAETTPGPLILVVEFVGFMAAFHAPGPLPPLWAGVIGAFLTVWVTFVPCFLWIFLGAPHVEALRRSVILRASLSTITAAVVGVIGNLSVWFALQVLFHQVDPVRWGPLHASVPVWHRLDLFAALLAGGASVAILRFRVPVPWVLAACAVLGVLGYSTPLAHMGHASGTP